MTNMATQTLPLLGVVLGALGSHLLAQRSEGVKFRRERIARWEDRRLDAYMSYAMALKLSIMAAFRMAAFQGNQAHASPLPPDEGAILLGDALPAREQAWENLLLVGNRRIISTATEWHRAVYEIEHFAKSQARDPAKWQALWGKVDALRAAY